MIWVGIASFTVLALLLLLRPLWQVPSKVVVATHRREAADLAVHRAMLHELDTDYTTGRIGADDARAARIEIERRLLAFADEAPNASPMARSARGRWRLAALLALVIAGSSVLAYLRLGAPNMPDQPIALRSEERAREDEIADLLDKLRAHLAQDPKDAQGWYLLGRTLASGGDVDGALDALGKARAAAPERADIAGTYGELLVDNAQGTVTPAAISAFDAALNAEPNDPRARFYLALAKDQAGQRAAALADWTALARSVPPDAPFMPMLRQRIADTAAALGQQLPELPRAAEAGDGVPTGEAADAIAGADPVARQAMIEGMVAKLAARLEHEPGDIDGWLRLGRAYTVLGEQEKARSALARAADGAPTRLDAQLAYARALYSLDPTNPDAPMPDAYIAIMRRVLTLDPENAEALWAVAQAETESGNTRNAVDLLRRLLARIPTDAPAHATVLQQLRKLDPTN